METFHREKTPAASPASSNCPKEDDALTRLLATDAVIGQVMKIIVGKLDETSKKLDETNKKLDETNKKLDCFHNELRKDLYTFQYQVNKLLDAKEVKDDKTTMEMTPTVTAKKSDNKGQPSSENCLGLPTILRRILEQFSDKELIKLSLVNKLWNYEARSVLRNRGCLPAIIRSESIWEELEEFASDLRQMRVVPFNGIYIRMEHSTFRYRYAQDPCDTYRTQTELSPAFQDILDLLPWKYLSVEFFGGWLGHKGCDCPAFVLVKRIVENYCGLLEEFSIYILNGGNAEFVQSIFQDRMFPSLKILRVHEETESTPVSNGFYKTLVSCAPNLLKLCIDGEIQFKENILEGSSAVLVPTAGFRPMNEHICESLIAALRAEWIQVFCRNDDVHFDAELLNRFVPMAVLSSQKSLKSLDIDLLFAVPLMCYGICMENVTHFAVYVNDCTLRGIQSDLNILTVVKGLDFTRLFPKLNRVKVRDLSHWDFSLDDIRSFVERGNVLAREALPDRSINIKHLELGGSIEDLTAVFLTQVFPHVKEISVWVDSRAFPFPNLWKYFSCIAELHVYINGFDTVNLDSAFCGIFLEEVAELREKDDEYLKAVNIVPVMPSITNMKDLRAFTLRYAPNPNLLTTTDDSFIFSKVTGLIAFARCPALAVTFQTVSFECAGVLSHMKPYVSFVIGE